MSQINVKNLTFAYPGTYDNIFENVSFNMDTDWKLGFIGRNGRGKTTFMKLLQGRYPYEGEISSAVTFDYFPYEVGNGDYMTLDVLMEIAPTLEEWEIRKELSYLNVDDEILYRQFNSLSQGEQTKVLLGVLFLKSNNFLLIDEPTNHLDVEGREIVSQYLKRKKGFIVISHDRYFLDNCIDHVLSINKVDIEVQKGTFSTWQQNKDFKDQFEINRNEKLKRDIKSLAEAGKRSAKWSSQVEQSKWGSGPCDRGHVGRLAAKAMKRSKSIEGRRDKALEEKERLLRNIENSEELFMSPLTYKKDILLEGENIRIAYDENLVIDGIDFTVESGDRIALWGGNGSGKSSLLKLIAGLEIPYKGNLDKGNDLIISYVPQNVTYLKGSLKDYAKEKKIDESKFKTLLRKLDFSREQLEKNIEEYSEGQKKKVALAASLCEEAHLYIWDEPLNYVDVISRIQIGDLISEYEPTMLLVEHDRMFLEEAATEIIFLEKNK